jgi:hypothetical protein
MITPPLANPFLLMMNPQAVFLAVESSDRLQQLQRHVFRPLDAPGPLNGVAQAAASFDALLEETVEIEEEDGVN